MVLLDTRAFTALAIWALSDVFIFVDWLTILEKFDFSALENTRFSFEPYDPIHHTVRLPGDKALDRQPRDGWFDYRPNITYHCTCLTICEFIHR